MDQGETMAMLRRLLLLLPLALALALPAGAAPAYKAKPEDILYLQLASGRITITMRPDAAPLHVARIRQLVRRGFYDGLAFHRVLKGFLVQTGDPRGNGAGGSGRYLMLEPSDLPHERGTVSMARGMHKDSADSQFFILMRAEPQLDRKYTVWGKVTQGMDLVDRLKTGDMKKDGRVTDPDRIVRAWIAADGEGKPAPAAPQPQKK
ncbi:peptidylprolyl isomerase [Niveispirillum sp. SYP-B3756]|uniref:peptidylprolyl isomerase n=1 Tax=Niveispirillum sp. SYP-B3756 TaxID=2662178 RepID=UPI001FFFCB57|nr:peptidylprolyl isomerase [Niveispirillum sp. SYP-B3756]